MSEAPDIAERRRQLLGELAELSMSLARDLHACALAAETPEEKAAMAAAFQKTARSVRQSLALHARLGREERQEARAADDLARAAAETAEAGRAAKVIRRRRQVQRAVERLIWSEVENPDDEDQTDEADALARAMEEAIEVAAEEPDFADVPFGALIERLCADIGLVVTVVTDPHPNSS